MDDLGLRIADAIDPQPVLGVNQATDMICRTAHAHGWNFEVKDTPEKIALMHSELSEALEEYRVGHLPQLIYKSEDGKPEGLSIELVDCLIRILHYLGTFGVDVERLLWLKMKYNDGRPHRHGGKLA